MSIRHHRSHRVARKAHYPSKGDQLDAIWKAIDEIANQTGIQLPQESVDMLNRIHEVKAKCPKEGLLKNQPNKKPSTVA